MTLLALAAAWVIGVYLGVRYDASIASAALLATSAVLLAGLLVTARRPLLPAVLLLFALLGILRSDMLGSESGQRLTAYHGLVQVGLRGWVADDPETSGRTTRFRFRVTEIDTGAAWEPASEDVLVTVPRLNELSSVRDEPFVRYGDRLLLTGFPESPQPFEDFDYPQYLARQGIQTVLSFPKLSLLEDDAGLAPYRWMYALRSRLSESRDGSSRAAGRTRPGAASWIKPESTVDGVRKAEGGWGATGEIAWVPFGVGRSADGLHRRTGAPPSAGAAMRGMAREYAAGNSLGGLARVCGDLRLSGGWVGRRRCRQAGSGMARSRAKARLNFSAQGQRSGWSEDDAGLAPYRWMYALRSRLSESLATAVPEPQAALGQALLLGLSPNPPKDTDGRREDSGRGWVRELQGRWPGVLGWMGGRRTVFSRRTGP